ncbi:MAG: hypothetical protein PHX83_08040 [Acidobacteriia bacterium]|nr:hypothetical protein [Terriglobia bacterium]
MSQPQNLQLKTYTILVPIIFFSAIGNVLLGMGMRQIGDVHEWTPAALGLLFIKVFTNGWIWLGIAGLLLFLISFMVILSWADFSFVMPASALNYVLLAIFSRWWLGESVTALRWTGVVCICVGVALITRTPSSTTRQN